MHIDQGDIIIENSTRVKCQKCKSVVAVINEETGQFLFRKVRILYIDKTLKISELRCRDCGEPMSINIFT
jgi:formylmethanofuran dehydrogenase subunit E